jgi:hypothetical protein
MFWNKWIKKNRPSTPQRPKLKPPAELPQPVGQYLVVNLGKDPDWVWELKAVVKPIEGDKKSARHFRVYDPVQAARQWVKIIDYHTLDEYPELILYEGNFDRDTHAVAFSVRESAKAA